MIESRRVELHEPSNLWVSAAEAEATRFAALLGAETIAIHHIGSTAIPGIAAKPIVDLMPEVRSLVGLDALEPRIRAAGYGWRGEYGLPGRRFCVLTDERSGRRRANIHCYEAGSPELARHLAFRDYLRAFPELARAYEREKRRCQALHPNDVFAYTDAKTAWIRTIERRALAWAGAATDAAPP